MTNWKLIPRYFKHVIFFNILGCFRQCTSNGKKLKQIKASSKKDRCFIVATGPSLTLSDLDMLSNEDTFAVNGIFLTFNKTNWRPKYYVCTDAPYFCQMVNTYNLDIDDVCKELAFLNNDSKRICPTLHIESSKAMWIHFSPWNRIYNFLHCQYNEEISKGMFAFGTVTNIAISIAAYMGYREIYLIGTDCNNLKQHIVNDVSNKEKDDVYLSQMLDAQLKGYQKIKNQMEKKGIHIYNATRGGALEVFPRVNVDSLFTEV